MENEVQTLLILLASAPLLAAVHLVGIYDFYFAPPNLLITTGDEVTWHNYGTNSHSTVHRAPAPLWNSGVLGTNADLQTWTPIDTNRPDTTVTNLVDQAATNRWRFYRVMQLP